MRQVHTSAFAVPPSTSIRPQQSTFIARSNPNARSNTKLTRYTSPKRPTTTALHTNPPTEAPSPKPSRRTILHLAALSLYATLPTATRSESQFSTYKGPLSLGFKFSYPSSWKVQKKPIKTHLSEVIVSDPDNSSTTAGLVVDAVKIESIDKFGSPETVGERVVAVERKKESVKNASVVDTRAVTENGLLYYLVEYEVESSRGFKRYLAKATITGGELFVFTAQAKVDGFDGVLREMVDSFSVAKQYL